VCREGWSAISSSTRKGIPVSGKLVLFIAFALTVMADPVSSVAYAIQAALQHLDGELINLVPTMALVVTTIAVVAATYHQLIRRFPEGGAVPGASPRRSATAGRSSRSVPCWSTSRSRSRSAVPRVPRRSSPTFPDSPQAAWSWLSA
jgi:hypothetical protein